MPYADKEKNNQYHRDYYAKNKGVKVYKKKSKEEAAAWAMEYRKSQKGRAARAKVAHKFAGYTAKYRVKFPEKAYEYERRKLATDMNFKLKKALRSRLRTALMTSKSQKVGSFVRDMGCKIDYLKSHLQTQFKEGMTWENYGRLPGQWSLDHIMPLCAFNLQDRQHFLLACHWGNLQPMWHSENMSKNGKH